MNIRWIFFVACLASTAQANPIEDVKAALSNTKKWFQQNLNSKEVVESEEAAKAASEPVPATTESARQEHPSGKAEQAVTKSGSWTDYLLLQHANDQDVLVEIVEEVNFGNTTLISNELSLGLYFGKNLFTSNLAFMYGSTTLSHEYITDNNIATKFEADHKGFAYGLRYAREITNFIFPYLGWSRAQFKSDVSQKLKVRSDEDSLEFPLATYDLKRIDMTALALGVDVRAHFWKVLTVGAGAGVEIPMQVSKPGFKKEEGTRDPGFQDAADDLASKLKQPTMHVNIHMGLAF